ncbi:MAG: PAS domain-containing protein, partial [Anaerotruncus rubiinfantis]
MDEFASYKDILSSVIQVLASHFGETSEFVLHDLTNGYESTIFAIENGHVTGRKVGDCGSNLGLEVLRGTVTEDRRLNYITKTKTGRTLRSSTL